MHLAEQASNGLEHRVRKAVEIEFNKRVSEIEK